MSSNGGNIVIQFFIQCFLFGVQGRGDKLTAACQSLFRYST